MNSPYTVIVGVYTCASLGSLSQEACGVQNVTFSATSGTTYYLRLAGNAGDSGLLNFTLFDPFI